MKRGILCPGFGAQYAGMGKELYDSFRVVQEYFEEASDCSGINFVKLCFASSDDDLAEVTNAALVLYLWGSASHALLIDQGVQIDMIGGLDMVGWYSALHGARTITFPDGLYMVRKWSELYSAHAAQSSDSYITISTADVAIETMLNALSDRLRSQGEQVAIVHQAPDEIVVSGSQSGISAYAEIVKREEKDIDIEFHTTLESPALVLPDDIVAQLVQYLEKIDFHTPQVPVAHPFEVSWLTDSSQVSAAARAIFMQAFRADFVIRMMQDAREIISAVPGERMVSRYERWLPQRTIWTMDTQDALNKVCSASVISQQGDISS